MTAARGFHLGDILSVTTERLVSPRGIDGVYDILNWMTGDSLFTHQLPRACRECQEPLLAQHPDLRDVETPEDFGGKDTVERWLAQQVTVYGETREITPLAAGDHSSIDPITEMKMINPGAEVIVVNMTDGPAGAR